jgi:hypothetical protein
LTPSRRSIQLEKSECGSGKPDEVGHTLTSANDDQIRVRTGWRARWAGLLPVQIERAGPPVICHWRWSILWRMVEMPISPNIAPYDGEAGGGEGHQNYIVLSSIHCLAGGNFLRPSGSPSVMALARSRDPW